MQVSQRLHLLNQLQNLFVTKQVDYIIPLLYRRLHQPISIVTERGWLTAPGQPVVFLSGQVPVKLIDNYRHVIKTLIVDTTIKASNLNKIFSQVEWNAISLRAIDNIEQLKFNCPLYLSQDNYQLWEQKTSQQRQALSKNNIKIFPENYLRLRTDSYDILRHHFNRDFE